MAVFMLNVCKFNSCGLKFQSLGHLIQHIEETHIDYDPHVVERTEQQQPACIPLSYVLRFLADNGDRGDTSASKLSSSAGQQQQKPQHSSQHHQQQPVRPASCRLQPPGSLNSTQEVLDTTTGARAYKNLPTPTGSEAGEEAEEFVSEPEDSNDSWTTLEEFSADFILRYGSRTAANQNQAVNYAGKDDKPFACPVPGCKKRYKNVNGIKYHSKNGHKNDGRVRKAFKCLCGKSYKSVSGLKNHTIQHNNSAGAVASSSSSSLKLAQPPPPPPPVKHQRQQTVVESFLDEQQQQQQQQRQQQQHIPRSNLPRIPKIKIPAIQDHGYMKQELYPGEQEQPEYETSELGVLTPAASPPLPSPLSDSQFVYQQHKCQLATSSLNSTQRQQLGGVSRPHDN